MSTERDNVRNIIRELTAEDIAEMGDYVSTEQFAELRGAERDGPVVNQPWHHHSPAREDQSHPAPWWPLAFILGACIGVPMLAFWIGRWTA